MKSVSKDKTKVKEIEARPKSKTSSSVDKISKKTNKVVKEKVVTEKKIKEKTAVLGKRKRQERPQKAISESD